MIVWGGIKSLGLEDEEGTYLSLVLDKNASVFFFGGGGSRTRFNPGDHQCV